MTSLPHADPESTPAIGTSVSADDFKRAFRGHPGGIAVITAYGENGPVALTASSVSSVSADPPLLIFSVSALSSATPTIMRLPTGEPVYHGVRAWLRCKIVSRMDAGGSTVIAAQALQVDVERDLEPGEPGAALVYHNRTWHRLGEHSRLD
ncbi:MAG: flavin reductase-like protein [Microbacterium sp.]|nr:flavin reductase-like protein [Microbacterium sp.]